MTLNEACDVWLNRLKLEGDKNDGPVRAGTRPRRRTDDDAYMFGTKGGARWDNQQNFRRAWDHLFACLDLLHDDGRSWASPHDARHWHASLLFEQDIPLNVISERLGHSTTTITAEIYVHLLGDRSKRDREAANRLGAALTSLSPRPDQLPTHRTAMKEE